MSVQSQSEKFAETRSQGSDNRTLKLHSRQIAGMIPPRLPAQSIQESILVIDEILVKDHEQTYIL